MELYIFKYRIVLYVNYISSLYRREYASLLKRMVDQQLQQEWQDVPKGIAVCTYHQFVLLGFSFYVREVSLRNKGINVQYVKNQHVTGAGLDIHLSV